MDFVATLDRHTTEVNVADDRRSRDAVKNNDKKQLKDNQKRNFHKDYKTMNSVRQKKKSKEDFCN